MRELHLFAGAGGGILGGILLGHTCVCAVEIEPYCRKILLQRQRDGILPKFPIWDDVRTFDGKPWRGSVDVVAGGFPCTDISPSKNRRQGIDGPSSSLWKEMHRIISEIRPRFVIVENSADLTFLGATRVAGDLAALGYVGQSGCLGADAAGLEHHRSRLWMVADSNGQRLESARDTTDVETPKRRMQRTEQAAIRVRQAFRLQDSDRSIGEIDGVAHRVDRLKAIGNGQVPAVVKLAWETLTL